MAKRLGLIVNPIAGIGGRVGLKGSDGVEIQRQALELGAVPRALDRATEALDRVRSVADLEVITYPAEMGAAAADACDFEPTVIGSIVPGHTTPQDTIKAARDMLDLAIDLLLFAGGDGTARDIHTAVNGNLPVLGVPAGVKIHSAVFATSAISAGSLAALYLQGRVRDLREAEVMDIDEDAFRQGIVSAELYGYLLIPYRGSLVQGAKAGSSASESASVSAIAHDVIDRMEPGVLYVVGPGTTTRMIASELGLDKTLLGVDVILDRKLVAVDANESGLIELVEGKPARIIVTPIGGQGFIFGRGNQQISHRVIQNVGIDNIIVVSTTSKLYALGGRPLLADTGDHAVDELLSGYISVITGYNEEMIYKLAF
jgi:predicted polyphosphate/ATP-dependent NAD kinase